MPKLRTISVAVAVLAIAALPSIASARHGHHRRGHTQATVSGTVASFQGGLLTIERADRTTARAAVTAATEIECEAADAAGAAGARIADHSGSSSDPATTAGRATGGNRSETDEPTPEDAAQDMAEDQGATEPADPSGPGQPACDSTTLTPGATVTRATIRSAGGGPAVFKQIRIAR